MYTREEGYFRGFNDFELFYQGWLTESPKGSIIITHGMGEHSESYTRFADGMAGSGYSIYAWDLRGHGRSEGKRGLIRKFTDFSEDLYCYVEALKKMKAPEPYYLLGHSMGGLVTARGLMLNKDWNIKGVILSSPLMGIAVDIPKIKEAAGKVVARWLPDFTMNNEISYSQLTRDRKVIEAYEHDHLRHDRVSAKLFTEMTQTIDYVLDHAVQINQPLLHMQAGHDTVVSVDGSRRFFNKVNSADKKFVLYDGYYHEIFNDIGREKAYEEVKKWLGERA